MLLGLSESLPALVEAKFNAAKANSAILFSPTEVTTIRTSGGIPFQLRYCPSLAKKPTASNPGQKTDGAPQKRDPFENPPQELLITELPSGATNASNAKKANTHILVLNKFPIIPFHFILATKANKPQTHALEEEDLEVAYACLKAWEEDSSFSAGRRLFAFFNSGEHSGASQPHRHLQFLPVETVRDEERAPGWDLLLDSILDDGEPVVGSISSPETPQQLIHHPSLPFTHFARRFPFPSSPPTGPYLHQTYTSLLNAAQTAVEEFITSHHRTSLTLHDTSTGSLPISYNLALTTRGMAILPRRAEGQTLRRDDGSDAGFVALNGTALGGTLMVKGEAEWDVLRGREERLDGILEAVGIPRGKEGEEGKPRI